MIELLTPPQKPPKQSLTSVRLTNKAKFLGANLTSDSDTVEVAIHNILYVRQIYPVELFSRRKKYDTPVWRSRHPELNEYISGAVKALGEELVLVRITGKRTSDKCCQLCSDAREMWIR